MVVVEVSVTGWNRDHARQQLRRRLGQAPGRATATVVVIVRRKTRAKKYSYDAIKVLQFIWATSGGSCGKYLARAMGDWLEAFEAHEHMIPGQGRYSVQVREEPPVMSPATIDRCLKPMRDKDTVKGKGTTKASTSLLPTSVTIHRAGDETGDDPGLFEVDTVAHCGLTALVEVPHFCSLKFPTLGRCAALGALNRHGMMRMTSPFGPVVMV